MGGAASLSLHKVDPVSSRPAGEEPGAPPGPAGEQPGAPHPHDEAEQTEPVSSPLRQGGEATGSYPPELRGRGATRSALDGEPGPRLAGSGTDSHGSLEAKRGPPRGLPDPRLHPQAPCQLPKAEQQGRDPMCLEGEGRWAV